MVRPRKGELQTRSNRNPKSDPVSMKGRCGVRVFICGDRGISL